MTKDSKNDVEKGGIENKHIMPDIAMHNRRASISSFEASAKVIEQVLTEDERQFILKCDHGDVNGVAEMIKMNGDFYHFDIDCLDPIGRSALDISIVNENVELMTLLLEEGAKVKEALLLAIDEDYVEGVELLLNHEEKSHVQGEKYSWESVDRALSKYTPDITPLILAAHKDNFEIVKMLLSRGATIPLPHDPKCSCDKCLNACLEDTLSFSLSRINAYRALAAPSLIALTSNDPILTAFKLSEELKKLRTLESQFSAIYTDLRKRVQEVPFNLLDHTRTSYELEILLNYELDGDIWDPGEPQTLQRVKLAIKCKQKGFVSHPNVQQLLASIWYEGIPGWRCSNFIQQMFMLVKLACMFPFYCLAYMFFPNTSMGKQMRHPFIMFTAHSSSFLLFLLLLAAASQRIEQLVLLVIGKLFKIQFLLDLLLEWQRKERGCFPSPIELILMAYANSYLIAELKRMYRLGLIEFMIDMWNLLDLFTSQFFMGWIFMRGLAFALVQRELYLGMDPYYPREEWHPFDPYLIAEGFFSTAMISSYLKLVHIFSINPHIGPLQISLGRMAIDIIKFLCLYILVLFAFACGMNQLLWYYSDLEYNRCYSLPGGLPDFDNEEDACGIWRRFSNLWETSQSLFWASFGLVDLGDFELTGVKEFTRFWGLLMFGSYSICNIIVLLNMLIAMMSNSYQIIQEKSDVEWKFARTKLWLSYFESGNTVPPPFNVIPTPKMLFRLFKSKKRKNSDEKEIERAKNRYSDVMKCIVKRFIVAEQTKSEEYGLTEDDINEVRQDVNKFRFELFEILKNNNFVTPDIDKKTVVSKKAQQLERRVMRGFNMSSIETAMKDAFTGPVKNKDFFSMLAGAIKKKSPNAPKDSINADPIGSNQQFVSRAEQDYKRTVLARTASMNSYKEMDSDELLKVNPKLGEYTPFTRLAYAKFRSFNYMKAINENQEEGMSEEPNTKGISKLKRQNTINAILEKAKSVEKEESNTTNSSSKDNECATGSDNIETPNVLLKQNEADKEQTLKAGNEPPGNISASGSDQVQVAEDSSPVLEVQPEGNRKKSLKLNRDGSIILDSLDLPEMSGGVNSAFDNDDEEIDLNVSGTDKGKSATTGQTKTGWL